MRVILQKTDRCCLKANGEDFSEIRGGLLVLIGISQSDTEKEADLLAEKILRMRIFTDENDKMNLSIMDRSVAGDILAVSNFTLYANCKSRRPDFMKAARPDEANKLYEYFLASLKRIAEAIGKEDPSLHIPEIKTGVFGAHMEISFTNLGPITIILDSDELTSAKRS